MGYYLNLYVKIVFYVLTNIITNIIHHHNLINIQYIHMDYLRQVKINKLQKEIDSLKNYKYSYNAACTAIQRYCRWFYNTDEGFKQHVINADMLYEESNVESHGGMNYKYHILLELKDNYVFICYDYAYTFDKDEITYLVTENKKFDIMKATTDFVNGKNIYNFGIDDLGCDIVSRKTIYKEIIDDEIKKSRDDCKYIKNPFIRKLIFGLLFVPNNLTLSIVDREKMHALLCQDLQTE